MPPALIAVEALDKAGHTAAGRHRRNACRSTRTPSRACGHACHRSLRVRPWALTPAQSRAAPARGWQHHVVLPSRSASIALLLPRSHGMSRSRRTLTLTLTRTRTPTLTPILILTVPLILTGSPVAECSRPMRSFTFQLTNLLTSLTRRTRPPRRWPAAALPLIIPPWPAEARPRSTRPRLRQGGIISGRQRMISLGTRASWHSESGG